LGIRLAASPPWIEELLLYDTGIIYRGNDNTKILAQVCSLFAQVKVFSKHHSKQINFSSKSSSSKLKIILFLFHYQSFGMFFNVF